MIDFGRGNGAARLIYRGIDISTDIADQVIEVNYTDHWHGENDEIDITVHDKDGLWKGSWFPEHGDTMELFLSDDGVRFVPCGTFELDEPNASGGRGGDTMTLRGLAAPISRALRTQNTKSYENMTLEAVVKDAVSRTGLTLEGVIAPLFFRRITQRKESDLEFLTRLANDTGHYFSVRGSRAIFTSYRSIDGQDPVLTIDLNDKARDQGPLIDYDLKFQSAGTYSKGSIRYSDPDLKDTVGFEEEDAEVKTGDEMKIRGERVESQANAEALLKARMHMANRKRKTGFISTVGNMKIIAGNVIALTGFGRFDDHYVIDRSTHSVSRSGFFTTGDFSLART